MQEECIIIISIKHSTTFRYNIQVFKESYFTRCFFLFSSFLFIERRFCVEPRQKIPKHFANVPRLFSTGRVQLTSVTMEMLKTGHIITRGCPRAWIVSIIARPTFRKQNFPRGVENEILLSGWCTEGSGVDAPRIVPCLSYLWVWMVYRGLKLFFIHSRIILIRVTLIREFCSLL